MQAAEGSWVEETVAGHPCDVYQPAQPHPAGFAVLYLHGVHQARLRGHDSFVGPLAQHGLRLFAPLTGPTWWSDRISPHFDPRFSVQAYLLEHLLPYLRERWQAEPPRIALLGTSMGGQGALRLAYKFPDTFPVVAAISPAIDFQLRLREGDEVLQEMYGDAESARQDTATLHIHPLNWPRHQFFCCDPDDQRWFDSVDRLRMKLFSLGVPHECDLETRAGGHGFQYYAAMAAPVARFLVERLQREQLRVA